MAALSINIFITSLYCLYLTADGIFLPMKIEDEDFEALCSRKCYPSPEDSFSDPLYQCSCSKSCTVYGDCCYDSSFRNTRKNQEHDFACLSVVKRGEFRAVISCPLSRRSDACRQSLGHLPPVTSRTTNITYGNLFCASCNGDEDNLITWNVHLRCDSEDESQGEETTIVYDSDGFWKLDEVVGTKKPCKYLEDEDENEVLEGLELRPCRSQEMISRCSPSWTDLSVIEMCGSYEDPVYFHNTAYRNLHCAECNFLNPEYFDCFPFYVRNMQQMKLSDSRGFDYCQRRDCLRALPEPGRGHDTTVSVMFDFIFDFRGCTPAYGKKCCPNEKFNNKTGNCRKVRRG